MDLTYIDDCLHHCRRYYLYHEEDVDHPCGLHWLLPANHGGKLSTQVHSVAKRFEVGVK